MSSYGAPLLFHLLPLVPLFFGFKWLALATLFLVIVSYVKVKKIEQQIRDLQQKKGPADEIAALEKAQSFWLGLTFMGKKNS